MPSWRRRAFLPILGVVATLCWPLWCLSCSGRRGDDAWPYWVELAEARVNVEVALRAAERQRGLMYRSELGENWGMLFVYEREEPLVFWMKNTTIPLSIAFLDRRRVVRDIQDMTPLSEAQHAASAPVMYALEVNHGWFARHDVTPGTPAAFSPELEVLSERHRQGEARGALR